MLSIELWQAILAVVVAGGIVGFGSRWWFGREIAHLIRARNKLDANHQSTLRMMSQTRKQVDDLQRLVTEYRRKLASVEIERRRITTEQTLAESLDAQEPPARVAAPPGGWADTQPLT